MSLGDLTPVTGMPRVDQARRVACERDGNRLSWCAGCGSSRGRTRPRQIWPMRRLRRSDAAETDLHPGAIASSRFREGYEQAAFHVRRASRISRELSPRDQVVGGDAGVGIVTLGLAGAAVRGVSVPKKACDRITRIHRRLQPLQCRNPGGDSNSLDRGEEIETLDFYENPAFR